MLVEKMLQVFIGQVNAHLLEAVDLKILKAKDVQYSYHGGRKMEK